MVYRREHSRPQSCLRYQSRSDDPVLLPVLYGTSGREGCRLGVPLLLCGMQLFDTHSCLHRFFLAPLAAPAVACMLRDGVVSVHPPTLSVTN
jgi:hypothetical protein